MRFFWCQLKGKNLNSRQEYVQEGFTILEIIVSTAIVLIISTQVLVNFSGLNEASTLDRAAQELTFNIRRAQNMALSIMAVNICDIMKIPRGVGIRLSSEAGSNDRYFFFIDQNENSLFDSIACPSLITERIEPDTILPSNIRITSITGEIPLDKGVHIIFYTPESRIVLSNNTGGVIPGVMDITLRGTSDAKRIIRIRTNGQVSVIK